MTDPTKEDLLAEIRAFVETAEAKIQPGDLTYRDIERALGYKHDKAQALMNKLVEAGKFKRIQVNGQDFKVVFRKVE